VGREGGKEGKREGRKYRERVGVGEGGKE